MLRHPAENLPYRLFDYDLRKNSYVIDGDWPKACQGWSREERWDLKKKLATETACTIRQEDVIAT